MINNADFQIKTDFDSCKETEISRYTGNQKSRIFLEIWCINALFAWLISHQPAVLFSQNKPTTNNQPAVLFSQNKPAPAISHQPTE
jgi:hypothetical protein